jgi:hypothetical protein
MTGDSLRRDDDRNCDTIDTILGLEILFRPKCHMSRNLTDSTRRRAVIGSAGERSGSAAGAKAGQIGVTIKFRSPARLKPAVRRSKVIHICNAVCSW